MKYKLKIALILIIFFIISQLIGLAVTASYKENFYSEIQKNKSKTDLTKNITENLTINKTKISIAKELIPEKVEIRSSIDIIQLVISFIVALIIATVIFIILMKIGVIKVMRAWLFFVVIIGLFISFSLLFYFLTKNTLSIFGIKINIAEIFAFILAVFLAYYKIYKRDIIVHNLTELFIYPGIVVLFLPLVNIYIVLALLLIISIYDVIAVFKTKHMQKMARFMIKDVRAFTGFLFPWIDKKEKLKLERMKKIKKKGKRIKVKVNIAALGGGDLALPMLFSSTVFLMLGLVNALLVILFATIGLTLLLIFGERDKAYPALPPLTIGCIVGYIIGLLI